MALLSALTVVAALVALPAAATAATSTSSALKQATGYETSQLQAKPVCGAAQLGQIRCLAQVLTVKRSGRTAALLHAPHVRPASHMASPATTPGQFTADYLQWAYDTTWLSANQGAADTVAIVDAYGDSTAYSDMEQFRSANGLPLQPLCGGSTTTSCFEVVNQNGQTSPLPDDTNDETGSWNIEESLDIDAISSICPLCKILMVEASSDDSDGLPDLETAVSTAARLGANQISLSWGSDTTPDAAGNSSPYSTITSAAILAASGDDSYPGPYIGYPAALPDVTAIGGTSLATELERRARFQRDSVGEDSVFLESHGFCGTESGCDSESVEAHLPERRQHEMHGARLQRRLGRRQSQHRPGIYDSQPGGEGCGTANNWCIVGGTSLATPLTAAFEAVTGVPGKTPAWAYSNTYAPLLNDIISGSNGTCPSGRDRDLHRRPRLGRSHRQRLDQRGCCGRWPGHRPSAERHRRSARRRPTSPRRCIRTTHGRGEPELTTGSTDSPRATTQYLRAAPARNRLPDCKRAAFAD